MLVLPGGGLQLASANINMCGLMFHWDMVMHSVADKPHLILQQKERAWKTKTLLSLVNKSERKQSWATPQIPAYMLHSAHTSSIHTLLPHPMHSSLIWRNCAVNQLSLHILCPTTYRTRQQRTLYRSSLGSLQRPTERVHLGPWEP